jgi:hypothetical protein
LSLDHIYAIAAELRKSDPAMSRAQAVAKAAQTTEGLEARRLMNMPNSNLPYAEAIQSIVHAAVAKAAGPSSRELAAYKRWRADLAAKSGSGPIGTLVEDPRISGLTRPADSLPAQPRGRQAVTAPISPADAIYAGIRAAALRAAPAGTTEASAIAAYLNTSDGQAAHARWNAARLE